MIRIGDRVQIVAYGSSFTRWIGDVIDIVKPEHGLETRYKIQFPNRTFPYHFIESELKVVNDDEKKAPPQV